MREVVNELKKRQFNPVLTVGDLRTAPGETERHFPVTLQPCSGLQVENASYAAGLDVERVLSGKGSEGKCDLTFFPKASSGKVVRPWSIVAKDMHEGFNEQRKRSLRLYASQRPLSPDERRQILDFFRKTHLP